MYSNYYYDYEGYDALLTAMFTIFASILGFCLILSLFRIIYNWVLFKKCGREGWESIIPIYNTIIKFQFLDIPMWMIIVLFIPGVNVCIPIILAISMAKKFDKDTGFTIGLIFLPVIFYPILAFGNSKFHKEIDGIFNTSNSSNNSNYSYCTECGTKVIGNYCTNCGKKVSN